MKQSLTIAALGAATLLAACGGSNGSSTSARNASAAAAPGVATFAAAADAVCQLGASESIGATRTPVKSRDQSIERGARLLALDAGINARLKKLTPPPSVKSAWESFVAERERFVQAGEGVQSALRKKDENAYNAAIRQTFASYDVARHRTGRRVAARA
jgi:hypothetical protein